jgi:hypothetical protein
MGNPQERLATFRQRGRKFRRWADNHRRWLAAALVLIAMLAVAARGGLGLSQTAQLEGIQSLAGHSFTANLKGPKSPWNRMFALRGDSNGRPTTSGLQLLEDGKPLTQPHAVHVDIAEKGEGRYSHWGPEGSIVYFSTSDNSSPLANGRVYAATYRVYLRGSLFAGVLLVALLALIGLYRSKVKHFFAPRIATPAPAVASDVRTIHPIKTLAFSVLSVVILSIMGLGLTVAADMAWRAIYVPAGTGVAIDTSFFEYRDYVVTTQPANLVLGNSKHPAEVYYGDTGCATPDGTKARFNSLGFRSPEFVNLPPKQPDEIRIIVTGGSASMSHNVSEACTLAVNLQRMLTERAPTKVVRIFTLGSGAWKSFQELIALQRYENDIKPDLIVAFDGFNDITHSFNSDVLAPYAGWRMADAYNRLRDWVWGGPLATFQGMRIVHDLPIVLKGLSFNLTGRANANSRFPDFASAADMATRFQLPVDRQRIANRTDFDPRNRKTVDQYLRHARLMDLLAENSGIAILHVLQPMLYLKEPLSPDERARLAVYEEMINYSIQGYLRMSTGLEEVTRGSKTARYLDLSAPFQGDATTYFYDYCHLNAAGYRVVSAKIADVAAEMMKARQK